MAVCNGFVLGEYPGRFNNLKITNPNIKKQLHNA